MIHSSLFRIRDSTPGFRQCCGEVLFDSTVMLRPFNKRSQRPPVHQLDRWPSGHLTSVLTNTVRDTAELSMPSRSTGIIQHP